MASKAMSRYAPIYWRRRVERRHPGLRFVEDPASDVSQIKSEVYEAVKGAIERTGFNVLAEINNRCNWKFLVATSGNDEALEKLVEGLIDANLRVRLTVKGKARPIHLKSKEHYRELLRRGPMKLHSLKAGLLWLRGRGYSQIGWHAAAHVELFDDVDSGLFFSRSNSHVPPAVQPSFRTKSGVSVACLGVDKRLDRVRFPIDVVYTWVDSNDLQWLAAKEKRARELGDGVHANANNASRYLNRDELRYSLRSLHYYAPWVRSIYIVSDNQVPSWFAGDSSGKVKFIFHRDLFPDPTVLPTFNSHAIESVLHRIPGLAEHFLYFNDDILLAGAIEPEVFYEANGIARTFFSKAMIPMCEIAHTHIASEWGAINANERLWSEAGGIIPHKIKHTPYPMRRSLLERLEERFADEFEKLRGRPFRTHADLAPTSSLHAYFGMAEGLVVRGSINYKYVDLASRKLESTLQQIAHSTRPLVYCLNDTEVHDPDFDRRRQEVKVRAFLETMYPYQAPWERRGE